MHIPLLAACSLASAAGVPARLADPTAQAHAVASVVSVAGEDVARPGAVRTILRAPKNLERFEPSGAVVLGDQLCVGSDKALKWGAARASVWSCYRLDALDGHRARPVGGGVVPGAGRIEGGARLADGRVAWWDAGNQRVWICAGGACLAGPGPDLDDVVALAATPRPCGVRIEGLAATGGALWLGLRGFELGEEGDCDDPAMSPHGAILDIDGDLLWDAGPLALDPDHPDRRFGISGLARSPDGRRLWMTWSYEGEGHDTDSVDGRLAWLPLTAGRLEPTATLRLCEDEDGRPLQLVGKPEALVLRPEGFIVVYDDDGGRKDRDGRGGRFELRPDEDFADLLPSSACARHRVIDP